MARRSRLEILLAETLAIFAAVGIPLEGLSARRRVKMAKAFLSVAGMKPGMAWKEATADHRLRTRDVIRWMNEHLGEDVSPGSYDDIRRKDLLLPVEAGIVLKSAGNESAATNDGTRTYALSREMCELLHFCGTAEWPRRLSDFLGGRETLAEQLMKARQQMRLPVTIGAKQLYFGPGEHNRLQKVIIEEFLVRFGHSAQVLYVGDTENKLLFVESEHLRNLGFFELSHDKLPDVLAYSKVKNWLFLIEAVHSANPITELRKRTLELLAPSCTADIVFVSAFLNRVAFRKFARDIAWETEVWIAETPDHLIHFNGDKFLGPHPPIAKPTQSK
ncbi:MAG: restriction endonuclease [Acidobacteriota bacterium]|nr:restriction endonuclease [Acidobacteriota bacterium]